jgi:hypothetical protein
MELKSVTGEYVRLDILDYEFPDIDNSLDGNWLLIKGEIHCEKGDWSFIDPSLTVEEALILGKWLKVIAEGKLAIFNQRLRRTTTLLFSEPNLSFSVISKNKLFTEIGISFTLESLPPWKEKSIDGIYPEEIVNLKIPNKLLVRNAVKWLDRLKLFPERGLA